MSKHIITEHNTNIMSKQVTLISAVATILVLGFAAIFYFNNSNKNPESAYHYYGLAQEDLAYGNYDQALYNANRAIEIDPSLDQAYKIRNNVNLIREDYDALIADFEKLIKTGGDDFVIYRDLSTLYHLKNNDEKSLHYADLALKENSEYYFFPLSLRGIALFKLGELRSAKKSFDDAYQEILSKNKRGLNDPELITGFFIPYSITLEKLEKIDAAKQILNDAVNYHEDSYLIHERLGFLEAVYYKNKKQSLKHFKRAKQLGSNFNPEEVSENLLNAFQAIE